MPDLTYRGRRLANVHTAAEWAAADTVLLDREIGYVSDTSEFWIGDGSTAYSAATMLPMTGPAGANGADGADGADATLSDADPLEDGTAAPGVSTDASRSDHVHPAGSATSFPLEATSAAAGDDILTSDVTGDSDPRFTIDADGSLRWGGGSAAADTVLKQRGGAGLRLGSVSNEDSRYIDITMGSGTAGFYRAGVNVGGVGFNFTTDANSSTIAHRIQAGSAAAVASVVKGAASQSANLQEWQDSAGAVLASVSSSGNLSGPFNWNIAGGDGSMVLSTGNADSVDSLTLKVGSTNYLTLGVSKIAFANRSTGFFGATPVAQPSGVAVTAAGIHAALVSLGLITA